jgi:acetolactate synthase small subunit
VELTGDQSKNDAFLQAIDRTAILETVRTGAAASAAANASCASNLFCMWALLTRP